MVTVLSLITTVTVVTVPRVIKEAQYLVRVSQSDDPYLYVAEGLHDLVVSEYAPEATNNSTMQSINLLMHFIIQLIIIDSALIVADADHSVIFSYSTTQPAIR